VGGFLLFYGRKAVAEAVFPLGFLLLMIPASEAVLSWATRLLKAGSAEGVSTLFTLTGTPHYREGFVFTLSTIAIEIADECSGIRSSIALLLTALLIGHWWLRSFWAKTLLIAAVLPLAILKNAVRIASLSFLAVHMDPGFVTGGRLHNDGGIVFFLLALGLLSPIVAVLRRLENSVRKCDPPLRGVAPIEATETN
jgi:exosortase